MRRKATIVVLGILLGACGFQTEQFAGDAALPPPTVGFKVEGTTQDENSGSIQVLVSLSRSTTEQVDASWEISGGTATIDVDYEAETSGTVSFLPGQTDVSIPLTILFDTNEMETNETIELRLTSATNAELDSSATQHTVTISSELLPRVNFALATSAQAEDGNIALEITLDSPPQVETTVTFGLKVSSTAAVGFDFTMPTTTVVTFPINTQSQTVMVAVTNDMVDEDDETVDLELTTTTNCVIGTMKDRTHTILNDDTPPTVTITTAAGATMEGNSGTKNVMITVELSGPSGKTVTVPLVFAGGTATENTDYSYASKTDLVFMPNQNSTLSEISKTVTIAIAGDTIDEDDQTIITSLGQNPINAVLGPMATQSQTQTITDDDNPPAVQFMTASGMASEGDSGTSTVPYTLVLSAASEKTIAFDILLTGTAIIPDDYTTIPAQNAGTVRMTITPPSAGALGATSVNLELVIVGDEVVEGADETIIMDISNNNMQNVTRGGQRTRTHTIDDSDPDGS